jgi:hypothetical protein
MLYLQKLKIQTMIECLKCNEIKTFCECEKFIYSKDVLIEELQTEIMIEKGVSKVYENDLNIIKKQNNKLKQSESELFNMLDSINGIMWESYCVKDIMFGRNEGKKIMLILEKWANKY